LYCKQLLFTQQVPERTFLRQERRGLRVVRDPDGSREAILAAAEEIFARCGFDATAMHAIGAAAGLSRSAPAYFFGSKNELYDAVLARVVERARTAMLAAYEHAGQPDSLHDTVANYVAVFFDFLAGDHAFVRLIQWEALADASRVEKLFGQLVDDSVTAFAPVAQQAGMSAQQLVLDVVALCWYPFAHGHTLLPALGMSPHDPQFLNRHKQHIVRVVIALAGAQGV
jgi:AcrR family transcriptional regulator